MTNPQFFQTACIQVGQICPVCCKNKYTCINTTVIQHGGLFQKGPEKYENTQIIPARIVRFLTFDI